MCPVPGRKIIKKDLLALLESVGTISSTDAYAKLASSWRLTKEEMSAERSGSLLYQHEIRWARQELKIAGLIKPPSASGYGIWQLYSISNTDEGTVGALFEGALTSVLANSYERNEEARAQCVAHYGFECAACRVNLETKYGAAGKAAIHVHHRIEISSVGQEYKVDPIRDLIPVWPNCHFIIHRRRPAFSIEEVKQMLAQTNAGTLA